MITFCCNGMRRARIKEERAFTLVELLVVIIIIGLLAAVAIPSFFGQTAKAQDTEAKMNLRNAHLAAQTVLMFDGKYPPANELVQELNRNEPSIEFVEGSNYPEGKVAVERISDTEIILRTRSASGNYFRWRMEKSLPPNQGREWATEVASSQPATNLFEFPSFELAALPSEHDRLYAPTLYASEQSSEWASSGSQSYHWAGKGSGTYPAWIRFPNDTPSAHNHRPKVEPGKTYTASLDIYAEKAPAKTAALRVTFYRASDVSSIAGSQSAPVQLHEGLQRVSITATAPPEDVASAVVSLNWDNTAPAERLGNEEFDLYFDSILFVEGTSTDYFDGASGNGASWRGTPHHSVSDRPGQSEGDASWRPW